MNRSVVVDGSAPDWAHELGRDINSALRGLPVMVNGMLALPVYTVATLPTPSRAGLLVYVSNEAGGEVMAVSDSAGAWRRQTDRAVVS